MESVSASAPIPAALEVRPVEGRRDRAAFINLQWEIYQDDPAWVPPLRLDRAQFLDQKKHPFFLHGAAQPLLALRDGRPVGRLVVAEDPNYNELHGTRQATVGLFEAGEDPQVAAALFDAAEAWARARGLDTLVGPIDYSTNYPCGLLIDGFDTPPRVMMNHNPAYYGALFEGAGFTKAKDLYAYWINADQPLPDRFRRVAELAARRGQVTLRTARMSDFKAEVARVKEIYNHAWEKNWGFVRMTDAEFDHLASELRLAIDPDLLFIAEVDGRPVGFSLALPDINEALAHLPSGRLTPLGVGKLLYYRKKIRTLRLVILGVLDGYRRRGIAELMILRTYDAGKAKGYQACEMSWTLEDNELINRPIELIGGERYKTYRIYQRPISPPARGG